MAKGCLVDTSFLITLANLQRQNHKVARSYFQYALGQGIPLYLSTLVATEFERGQPLEDLGLHYFMVLPLNLSEAIKAAKLASATSRDDGDHRNSVAIDLMLLAQAHENGVEAILTEDRDTLAKYCDRLRGQQMINCQAVLLDDGFDPNRLLDPRAPGLGFPAQDE